MLSKSEHSELGDATGNVTELLRRWSDGQPEAHNAVFARVYPQLKRIAARQCARQTQVSPTELVHEAYQRLEQQRAPWLNRSQFYSVAARILRRVLLDLAVARGRQKRGGGALHVDVDSVDVSGPSCFDVLALQEALEKLSRIDELAACIVEQRYFAGATVNEAARQLGVSRATVVVKWRAARAWLRASLSAPPGRGETPP